MSSYKGYGKNKRVCAPMKAKPKKHHCKCKTDVCNCNFKAPARKTAPLNSDCVLVNSVVCSKTVQKVAETTLPATLFGGLDIANIASINVVPNLEGITQNVRVIRDKVVNIGLIPATISITLLDNTVESLTTSIPFQEHTDCPGACPQDMVQETPLEVEGIFTQQGVPVVGAGGLDLVDGILVKIILRTTITVTRQLIQDADGNLCDVNPNRCDETTTPPSFTLPAPPNSNGNGGGTLP